MTLEQVKVFLVNLAVSIKIGNFWVRTSYGTWLSHATDQRVVILDVNNIISFGCWCNISRDHLSDTSTRSCPCCNGYYPHRRELKEKEIGKKGEKRTEQAVSWYGQKKLVQAYQEKRHAKALASYDERARSASSPE